MCRRGGFSRRAEGREVRGRRIVMEKTMGLLFFFAATAIAQTLTRRVIDFESDRVGQTPAGFTVALTGSGRAGVWQIKKDENAPERGNVLAQVDADTTSYRFPLAVVNEVMTRDVDL